MTPLKPQDFAVALIRAVRPEHSRYADIARAAGLSVSEAHAATQRARDAHLLSEKSARHGAILEFAVHGVRYAFPASWTTITRGIPTARSAPALAERFADDPETPVVWPDARGTSRGLGLEPLYRALPRAVVDDERLYAAFSAIELMRTGGARERNVAKELLVKLFAQRKHASSE